MAADAVLHGELNVSVELDIQMPLGELLQRFVQVVMAGRAAAGVRLEREGVVQRGVCGRALDLNAVVQRFDGRRILRVGIRQLGGHFLLHVVARIRFRFGRRLRSRGGGFRFRGGGGLHLGGRSGFRFCVGRAGRGCCFAACAQQHQATQRQGEKRLGYLGLHDFLQFPVLADK